METKLEYTLTHTDKAELVKYIKARPAAFEEALALVLKDKQPYSWKAAWALWSCMDKNDKRVRKYLKKIISSVPARKDNQQRELLMILLRMEINESYEAQLLDTCIDIWKNVGKNPSLRWNALKLMFSISKKHPDLSKELQSLTSARYTDTLSPSVKRSILRLKDELAQAK